MPRPPLPRTLLAVLPILGALLAALAAAHNWPMPLSLGAMAVVACASAVIYWSAPLSAPDQSGETQQALPTAHVPHAAPDPEATPVVAAIEAAAVEELSAAPEPGTAGTRADALATGVRYETDLLTGLLAPESFFLKVSADLERCRDANQTAILVVCDLDAFGEMNRTVGLVDANRMLRQVADCFRLTVREGDVLSRLGGDEFGIFFPGLPSEIAETRVRDLRAAVREAGLLTLPEGTRQATVCVGSSAFPADGATLEELLAAADRSLAEAKRDRSEQADRPIPSALVLTRG